MTNAPPSNDYFEGMHRLKPEPPDEETVKRILEIYRARWEKQEQKGPEPQGVGGGALFAWDPRGLATRLRHISRACSPDLPPELVPPIMVGIRA